MRIFIDIETIPCQPEKEKKAEIAETIQAPATMSKPETIADWHNGVGKYEGAKDALIDEVYRKTSLNALYGSICSIAYATDSSTVYAMSSIADDTEKDILEHFFESVYKETSTPFFVGHNVAGFDLKYIWQRSKILNVQAPFPIPWNGRHDKDFYCTMQGWAGYRDYVKMDTLAKAFGIEGKGDMDGSKVWDEWKAGNYQRVIEYNRDDVRIVREIYERMAR